MVATSGSDEHDPAYSRTSSEVLCAWHVPVTLILGACVFLWAALNMFYDKS